MLVRVMIDAPAGGLPAGGACLRVFVEDTSRLDVAARPVAVSTLAIDELASHIPVEMTCREPAADESFTVRVHVDVGASGNVTVGDLISTQAHQAIDGDVRVPLTRVTGPV